MDKRVLFLAAIALSFAAQSDIAQAQIPINQAADAGKIAPVCGKIVKSGATRAEMEIDSPNSMLME